MTELPPSLFQRWVHVREEDTDDVRVYRPFGTDLPPARGRCGLEFREDGTFVEYGLGQADRPQGTAGHWDADAENRVRVAVPDPARARKLSRSCPSRATSSRSASRKATVRVGIISVERTCAPARRPRQEVAGLGRPVYLLAAWARSELAG